VLTVRLCYRADISNVRNKKAVEILRNEKGNEMNMTPNYTIYRVKELFVPAKKRAATLNDIILVVSEKTRIPISLIIGRSRKKEIVEARHLYAYFAWNTTNYVLRSIANSGGLSNHTSVLHAKDKINDILSYDKILQNMVGIISETLTDRFVTQQRVRYWVRSSEI
jgi:chromosomal replication initiation ATPase DnaA